MQSYAELMSEINECLRGLVVQTEIPTKPRQESIRSESVRSESANESQTQKAHQQWIPVKVHGVPGTLVRRVRKN